MTPHEYLAQQAANVEQALTETLRYEYGPKPTGDYYVECRKRLDLIKDDIFLTNPTDLPGIEARLQELTDLSVWISLIERSRLGEFSWPFAESLRGMAEALLIEPGLFGLQSPIVHIVADGEGYFIHYEKTSASGRYKFTFINFPRPLKHHVLLHSLFGHELGHTALHTAGIGSAGILLQSQVLTALQSAGPLNTPASLNAWIHSPSAPHSVQSQLAHYISTYGEPYALDGYYYLKWIDELICDLFGLLLFGPGFAAAHQVYLRPTHSNPYGLALTHPPYATRHKMLVRAIQLIGWDTPVTSGQPHQSAELDLINYILTDPYDPWATLLTDAQLNRAIAGIRNVFASHGGLGYVNPDGGMMTELVNKLTLRLPPILADLTNRGRPELARIDIAHTLYAGWIYLLGYSHFTAEPLSFLVVNKLCDHALLQQKAINIAIQKRMK